MSETDPEDWELGWVQVRTVLEVGTFSCEEKVVDTCKSPLALAVPNIIQELLRLQRHPNSVDVAVFAAIANGSGVTEEYSLRVQALDVVDGKPVLVTPNRVRGLVGPVGGDYTPNASSELIHVKAAGGTCMYQATVLHEFDRHIVRVELYTPGRMILLIPDPNSARLAGPLSLELLERGGDS